MLWAATHGLPAVANMSQTPGTVAEAQAPALQVWPLAQALPHVPQLTASVCKFLQVPEQLV